MHELYHHGIKGQKWGVRNGPPYPLEKGLSISRGSIAFRAVSLKEGDENYSFKKQKYTYVDMTDDFANHSIHTSEGFDGRFNADVMLKTKRKLQIASPDDYMNAILSCNNINIDVALKEIPNDVTQKGEYFLKNHRNMSSTSALGDKGFEGDRSATGENKSFNDVMNYLKKQGFDGCVDPIDWDAHREENTNPMVIFDPDKNLEIVWTERR